MLNNNYVTKLINLEGVKFNDIDIQENTINIFVAPMHDVQLCPKCSRTTSKLVDITPKVYRDLDLACRTCNIEIDQRRFECLYCFCTFTESLLFAGPRRHYTRRFEQAVYECCRETTATYAASKFGISDKTATEIYLMVAKRKQQVLLQPTQVIGIDEIAMRRGH